MLLTIKNLVQETFQVEIQADQTVKDLKEKIESSKGSESYPSGSQKLIYAGKIMEDSEAISSYNVDEKKFIVVMVAKKPAAPASSDSAPPAAAPASTGGASAAAAEETPKKKEETPKKKEETPKKKEETPKKKEETPKKKEETPKSEEEGEKSSSQAEESSDVVVMGDDYNKMVQNIVDMGYDKESVISALRASFNNPDRAVEYLINGIPPSLLDNEPPTQQPQVSLPASEPETPSNPAPTGGGGENPLAFLRNQEQFQQMRRLLQSNPSMLNAILQQIGESNPQLLEMISRNQEDFIRLINESNDGGSSEQQQQQQQQSSTPSSGGGLADPGMISLTPQDRAAIDRLKALGFPEHLVVQAYFACEKNENVAANFLLSQCFGD
eukprot:TRINITY_DN173_c0_g1_i5.p1 TRINITY_DN173_c0_g1~~TRINITY_DN173_c0_g1_i5.p1  ORF type:complete len:383 (+),score=187.61 TRINITY_DN173_c0_g1_i5:126-1274(+)